MHQKHEKQKTASYWPTGYFAALENSHFRKSRTSVKFENIVDWKRRICLEWQG